MVETQLKQARLALETTVWQAGHEQEKEVLDPEESRDVIKRRAPEGRKPSLLVLPVSPEVQDPSQEEVLAPEESRDPLANPEVQDPTQKEVLDPEERKSSIQMREVSSAIPSTRKSSESRSPRSNPEGSPRSRRET